MAEAIEPYAWLERTIEQLPPYPVNRGFCRSKEVKKRRNTMDRNA